MIEYRTRFQIAVLRFYAGVACFGCCFFSIAHAKVVPAVPKNPTNSLLLLFFLFFKNIFSLLFCYCAIIWRSHHIINPNTSLGAPSTRLPLAPFSTTTRAPFLFPVQPLSPITEKTTHCPFS